jgi:hypothetical protein
LDVRENSPRQFIDKLQSSNPQEEKASLSRKPVQRSQKELKLESQNKGLQDSKDQTSQAKSDNFSSPNHGLKEGRIQADLTALPEEVREDGKAL